MLPEHASGMWKVRSVPVWKQRSGTLSTTEWVRAEGISITAITVSFHCTDRVLISEELLLWKVLCGEILVGVNSLNILCTS